MLKILGNDKQQLLSLDPQRVDRRLTPKEILYIFEKMGGFWHYDHENWEKPGYHALLKSGNHSDGFLNSKEVLKHPHLCHLMAEQLLRLWKELHLLQPTKVAGIPNGATGLGKRLSLLMGVSEARISKVNGKIKGVEGLDPQDTLLLVEDFCTKGTGFKEAVAEIKNCFPSVEIFPFELTIVNRGGLKKIKTKYGSFQVLALAKHKINDWPPLVCPLCLNHGSTPIKPKETQENWELITTSQK